MSLLTIAVVNAILAVAVVAALAFVCYAPFRFSHAEAHHDSAARIDSELLAA